MEDNCIATRSPELVAEFDLAKNYPLTPDGVLYMYTKKLWWKCARDHEFEMSPFKRTSSAGQGATYTPCQECRRDRTNLLLLFPEIAAEFDTDRNGDVKVDRLEAGSGKKFWWICSNDSSHSWQMTPDHRTRAGGSCPQCLQWGYSKQEVRISFELQSVVPYDRAATKVKGAIKSWKCDMVLEEQKTVVEFDGEYFHGLPGAHGRDVRKTSDLEAAGWRVVRIRSEKLERVRDWDLIVDHFSTPSTIAQLLIDHLKSLGVLEPGAVYTPGAGEKAAEEFLRQPRNPSRMSWSKRSKKS